MKKKPEANKILSQDAIENSGEPTHDIAIGTGATAGAVAGGIAGAALGPFGAGVGAVLGAGVGAVTGQGAVKILEPKCDKD